MKIKQILMIATLVAGVGIAALTLSSMSSLSADEEGSSEPIVLNWDDLIPADFVQPENPLNDMTQEEIDKLMDGSEESNAELARLEAAFSYAPVVPELDGRRVKLPAYVTPLDFDNQMLLKEFLLVPYMGACIHTPPPPANQVVFAKSEEMVELSSPYQAVWAIGTLKADTIQSGLAEAGYQLEVETVLPYEPLGTQ